MTLETADGESRTATSKRACRISVSCFVSVDCDAHLAELRYESELIHDQ